MSDLATEIEDAEARLALLRQQAASATCREMGRHEWKHIGGKNCGCHEAGNFGCSVPVYECTRCGDCDYGDNLEANEKRAACRAQGRL